MTNYPDSCEVQLRRRKRSCKLSGSLCGLHWRRQSRWPARCCTRPAGRAAWGSTSSLRVAESRAGRGRRGEGSSTSCRVRDRPQPWEHSHKHEFTLWVDGWLRPNPICENHSHVLAKMGVLWFRLLFSGRSKASTMFIPKPLFTLWVKVLG